MARKSIEPVDDRCVCEIVEALKSDDPSVQVVGLRRLRAKFAFWLRGEILELLEQRGISEHYAGDLLEKTMESVVKHIHGFDQVHSPPTKFPIWMVRFAFNHVRNQYRQLNPKGERPNRGADEGTRSAPISLDQLGEQWDLYETVCLVDALTGDSGTASPEAIFDAQDLHIYFLSLHEETLKRLNPIHRAILTDHRLEGASLREVAERNSYSYPYVRNQSLTSKKHYWAVFLELLKEQEQQNPDKFEYIQQIRQLIVAYGDSHD